MNSDSKNQYKSGELYIVPTPVGNLDDITIRAVKVLKSVDIIACEDTRHSGILLKKLEILPRKLESLHEHNEQSKSEYLLKFLSEGKNIALISDAGTPAISDPGYRLIKKCISSGVKIIPLPGATAFVPALCGSGFNTESFYFAGFPPHKKGRQTFFEKLKSFECTIILYESPYRILTLLSDIEKHFPSERKVCIAREISKLYEEFSIGTVLELKAKFAKPASIKGEFVVLIDSIY